MVAANDLGFELLDEGFFQAAEDIGISIIQTQKFIRQVRDLYVDRQLDYYASEVETSPFSPGSIGMFSPGRGRNIQIGDKFARASGDLLSQLLDAKLAGFETVNPLVESGAIGAFNFSQTAEFGFVVQAKGEKALRQEQIQQSRFGRSLVGPQTIDVDEIEEGWLQAFQEAYVTLTGRRSGAFTTSSAEFQRRTGFTRAEQRRSAPRTFSRRSDRRSSTLEERLRRGLGNF